MPPVLLSLFERIARASGGVTPPPATVDDLRREVVRHLEWVLNSRRGERPLPEDLDRSILGYGLPDFKVNALDELRVRDRIADVLGRAVRRFEPRLSDVEVTVGPDVGKDLRLRVQLTGMLLVKPEPLPFQVETLLDLSTREVIVT